MHPYVARFLALTLSVDLESVAFCGEVSCPLGHPLVTDIKGNDVTGTCAECAFTSCSLPAQEWRRVDVMLKFFAIIKFAE